MEKMIALLTALIENAVVEHKLELELAEMLKSDRDIDLGRYAEVIPSIAAKIVAAHTIELPEFSAEQAARYLAERQLWALSDATDKMLLARSAPDFRIDYVDEDDLLAEFEEMMRSIEDASE